MCGGGEKVCDQFRLPGRTTQARKTNRHADNLAAPHRRVGHEDGLEPFYRLSKVEAYGAVLGLQSRLKAALYAPASSLQSLTLRTGASWSSSWRGILLGH